LLEEPDDLPHVLFAQPVEHAANGAKNLHVLAGDAIAVELANDGLKLVADFLGGGLDLLLLEFLGGELSRLFKPKS
jgi:hypothetical protein